MSKFNSPMCSPLTVSACANTWKALSNLGIARIDLENLETMDMGDTLAADRSAYVMFNENNIKVDHGKYVLVVCK